MEIQDLKEFLNQRNNGVEPVLTFNQDCMKRLEINFANGQISEHHHVEYDHVMVDEGNGQPYRMKISNHREMLDRNELQQRFGI